MATIERKGKGKKTEEKKKKREQREKERRINRKRGEKEKKYLKSSYALVTCFIVRQLLQDASNKEKTENH